MGLRAVVTGASSGIGRELSKLLCRNRDSRVVGIGRNAVALGGLEKEFAGCFHPVVADLSSLNGVEEAARKTGGLLDRIDLLVNNAGFGLYKRVLEHSEEEAWSLVAVNMVAPIVLTKRLLHLMRPGSTAVFVISAGAHVVMLDLPLYGAAKAGLDYAVKALRRELAEKGIHVLAVYPGVVKTSFHTRGGRPVDKGLDPRTVAEKILGAVKKRKKTLYVPRYLAVARLLSPLLPPVRVGGGSKR